MVDTNSPLGRTAADGSVVAVHRSEDHTFSKQPVEAVMLVAGIGVEGDVHAGARVKHRSRVRADPDQPNLRQVHLIPAEVLAEVAGSGFTVQPGELGENVTTAGLDLLGLPVGALLRLGADALVAVTGLRNPCVQIDGLAEGLLDELRRRDTDGTVVRRAGIMGVVVQGGVVRAGDSIAVALPPPPHHPLERV